MNPNQNSSQASNGRLSWGERLAFGAGAIGAPFVFTIVSSMLTIYLTNVVHLNIGVVSSIIAASALLDGLSDLIAGNIVDRTVSRLGRARPWVLRMALPLALSVFLLFRVPKGIPEPAQYVYLFLLYNLTITCFYTMESVAQDSMVSLLSPDGKEQALLGIIRAIGMNIGVTVASISFVQLLPLFSDDAGNPETQGAYSGAVAVFCCVVVILTLLAVLGTRERVDMPEAKSRSAGKPGFFKTAKALLQSKYWVMLALFGIVLDICVELGMGACAYFSTYVLGDLGKMSLLMTATQLSSLLAMFAVPVLMERFGKRPFRLASDVGRIRICRPVRRIPRRRRCLLRASWYRQGNCYGDGVGHGRGCDPAHELSDGCVQRRHGELRNGGCQETRHGDLIGSHGTGDVPGRLQRGERGAEPPPAGRRFHRRHLAVCLWPGAARRPSARVFYSALSSRRGIGGAGIIREQACAERAFRGNGTRRII